jgi:hypothetical protein
MLGFVWFIFGIELGGILAGAIIVLRDKEREA